MQVKEQYLACLKEHANQAEACRELAKIYLECRMDRCGWLLHAREQLCERLAERYAGGLLKTLPGSLALQGCCVQRAPSNFSLCCSSLVTPVHAVG